MAKSCSHATVCELFSQFTMESTLRIWRINYCDSHYVRCERYERISQGLEVPPNLLPNGKTLPQSGGSC